MEYHNSLLDEVQCHIDMMVFAYEDYIKLLYIIPSIDIKYATII